MENQNNNLQELEELRSQVAEFKNRIEKQEIVSRHLLDEAMKGHVSWIKQMSIWVSVAELVLLPLIVYTLRSIVGISWIPIIVIGIAIVGEAVFNFWNVSSIRDKHLTADDVLNAQQRLMTFKRREKLYTYGIIPLLLPFVAWIMYDRCILFHSGNRLIVDFVMFAIAFAAFFYVFYREMRSLNKAIKEIDKFAKD